jgi:outer membrane protein OmpA-like peptidoglycan-associated protein/tetratricopeptide (TPR) repeat protein
MNTKRNLLLILMLVLFLPAFSQKKPLKIKRADFKKEEYGFKEAWKALKAAQWLYAAGPGSYRDARDFYLQAYKYNNQNPELNYMIGRCYLFTDNKYESIKYIKKAFELKPDVNFDIHLLLGMAYHQTNDFDNAIEEYNMFLNNLSKKHLEAYQEWVNTLVRQCKYGRDLVMDPKRVVINNLGENINSIFDEYSVAIPADNSEMYFTSRRNNGEKNKRSLIDDKFFEDIYHSEYVGKEWSRATRLDKKIVGKKHNTHIAVVGISSDKNILYIYKGKEKNGDIYKCELKKGKWAKPKRLKKFNTKYHEASMCSTADGKLLFFTSDRKKDTYGGTDIFYSTQNAKGRWSKPLNLGSTINTMYDEVGLSLSANDSVLYFSSQGLNSMGGYDVFKTIKTGPNQWSKPENLGYPINTPDDDVFYVPMPDNKTAFYSSNRESGIGGLDIYKITYLGAVKDNYIANMSEPLAGLTLPIENIYYKPPVSLVIDNRMVMKGYIRDSESKKGVKGRLELIDRESSEVVGVTTSDTSGLYTVYIPQSKIYGVDINATGYLMYLDNLDLSGESSDKVIYRDFQMDRVEVGAKVILKNINFETGKSTLLPDSYVTLNAVVKLIQTNPTIQLEISGHTDNVGSDKFNLKLSNDRAKSVVDYLVAQGIPEAKLTYKGYGKSQPISSNATPEGRAENRRVEFKIISK